MRDHQAVYWDKVARDSQEEPLFPSPHGLILDENPLDEINVFSRSLPCLNLAASTSVFSPPYLPPCGPMANV